MKPTRWFRFGSRARSTEAPVSQSGSHVTGNDSRLMRDLENDCVDRDIYDEEIRSRQNQEPTLVLFELCLRLSTFLLSSNNSDKISLVVNIVS